MASQAVSDVKAKIDKAWANLARQLDGMEPHLERSDAPGEWTTREVLSHLLFQPGWKPDAVLKTFVASGTLAVVEIEPGKPTTSGRR